MGPTWAGSSRAMATMLQPGFSSPRPLTALGRTSSQVVMGTKTAGWSEYLRLSQTPTIWRVCSCSSPL